MLRGTLQSCKNALTNIVMSMPTVLNTSFHLLHDILTKIAANDEAYSAQVARAQINYIEDGDLWLQSLDLEKSDVGSDNSSTSERRSEKSFDADATSNKTRSASQTCSEIDPERSHTTTNSLHDFDPESAMMTPRSADDKHPNQKLKTTNTPTIIYRWPVN